MLTRIIDTSDIETDNLEIQEGLKIDLKRMDRLPHKNIPKNVDAYRVKIKSSIRTYMPGLYRFRFEVQYGNMKGDEFKPRGKPVLYQTETLPMI